MGVKKLIFLLISIVYSISSLGQHKVTLNYAITINLPNSAEKISKEQALVHVTNKFNNDKIVLQSMTNSAEIYKIDDILIRLIPHNETIKEGQLLNIKKGQDEFFHGDVTYKATLKKINNNQVLITSNIINNIERIDFYCYDPAYNTSLTGVLHFNIADEKEANTILDDLLKSIEFKN